MTEHDYTRNDEPVDGGAEQYETSPITEEEMQRYAADEARQLAAKFELIEIFKRIRKDSQERYSREFRDENPSLVTGNDELASILYEAIWETIDEAEWLEVLASILGDTAKEAEAGPDGFVYILRAGEFVKIGRSRRLDNRIKTLKIQLPFPVEVLNAFPCENAAKSERHLHEFFAKYRVNGEWFELPEKVLAGWLIRIEYMVEDRCEFTNDLANHHESVPAALMADGRWGRAFKEARAVKEMR